ncbi:MAG: homogentisate 1,2-dioxygenase [Calditrichae bacterium]|nr:homogentisate 1,2-dioxygenase [Calditrichota bacterium]MCB9059694.1 homogentisate 1,2-dioxygenase [Calditrichia bacterium]
MPFYVKHGSIPPKRHTQHRDSKGNLYYEELIGREGFSDIYSNVYHIHPPTKVKKVGDLHELPLQETKDVHRHRHLETFRFKAKGDWVTGRRVLMYNNEVNMSVVIPEKQGEYFYRNAHAYEVIFVHKGNGKLDSIFGQLNFSEGDYIVIPGGTLYTLTYESDKAHFLVIEAFGEIAPPKRYLNKHGQLLEHAPFCERDIRVPEFREAVDELGDFPVHVKTFRGIQEMTLAHHPFDAVGWDGYYYPWIFNIKDFMSVTGKIHQPPPVHQTFEGPGFVICSFCPRLFDYHELSIPAPYAHSNVDSDEILYYVEGDFMSRKGVSEGSVTIHPSGLPHGPQPGRYEGSIGVKETFEYAVMLDTFRPLHIASDADEIDDGKYHLSWNE